MNYVDARLIAQQALAAGKYEDAISAANFLVNAGDPWLIDGLLRRALALESWTEGPSDRLLAAVSDWQRLVEIAPASVAFRGLARVLLKLGERDAALANLIKAEERGGTPEVMLGFAEFYRTASPPDLKQAKMYFRRAALRGRTQGMLGYVEVAFELDQAFSAYAMTLLSLAVTPFLALILRERRHDGF